MKPTLAPPKKGGLYQVAIYLRVSIATERSNSHTLSTQVESIERDLNLRLGVENYQPHWFTDDGLSGVLGSEPSLKYRKIRPEFKKMRQGLRQGEYDIMAIHSVSRLARESRHVDNVIKDELVPTNTDFYSVTESGIDIFTPEGIFQLQIMSSNAELQRAQIAKRCEQASESSFLKGYPGGPVGYGWVLDSPLGRAHKQRQRPGVILPSPSEHVVALQGSEVQTREAQAGQTGSAVLAVADSKKPAVADCEETLRLEGGSDAACGGAGTADSGTTGSGTEVRRTESGHYRTERADLLPVAEEREVVLWMKDLLFKGRNLTTIARELNSKGVLAARGGRWTVGSVKRVLTDPTHAGYVHRDADDPAKRRLRQGQHFARRFYDPEEFERIEARLSRQAKSCPTRTASSLRLYPLNGLVHCAHCGSRLHIGNGGSPTPTLRCINGIDQGERTCPELTVRFSQLQQQVEAELMTLGELPEMQAALHQQALRLVEEQRQSTGDEMRVLERSMTGIERRIETLFDTLGDGTIERDLFDAQIRRLQGQKSEVQSALDAARTRHETAGHSSERMARVHEALQDFPALWSALDGLERHQILDLVIERLTVHRAGERVTLGITVYGFAERCVGYDHYRRACKAMKRKGLEELTDRELAALHHWSQGLRRGEIAQKMGVIPSTVSCFLSRAREIMGTIHLDEIAALARTRINQRMVHLPLGPQEHYTRASGPLLSSKLMEILPLVINGASTREICEETGLTPTTVAGRRTEIFKILEVKSSLGAARKVRELKLLE